MPADLSKTFTWSIGGAGGKGAAAIGGYNPTTGPTYVVPLNPNNSAGPTFPGANEYYYYTSSGSETASVTPSSSGIPPARTTFSVAKPVVTVSTVKGKVAFDSQYPNAPPPTIHDGLPYVGYSGIKFTATQIPSGYSDGVVWGQVYYANDSFTAANGTHYVRDGSGLDTKWPYGANSNLGDGQYATDDSPMVSTQIEPSLVGLSVDDNPVMYLMYQPAATNGTAKSIEVPIQCVSWGWSGSANLANGVWTPGTLLNTAPSGVDTNSYPEWIGLMNLFPQPG